MRANQLAILILLLPTIPATGCREPCSDNEVRYGDRCVLRPDSGVFRDEDASAEEEDGGEWDDEMDAWTGAPEEDGSLPSPTDPDDAGGAVDDTGTSEPLCPDADSCHRKVVHFTYGAPGCAILDDGTLWCWGGVDGPRTPRKVGTRNDWQAVSSTDNVRDESGNYHPGNHACAIAAGVMYCWGDNYSGQLGIGAESPERALEPRRVGDATDWSAVSTTALTLAGTLSCGIRGGSLYCWGDGPGSTRIRTPMRVGMRDDWSSISVNGLQSCGIAGGAVRCWSESSSEFRELFVSEPGNWTHVSSGGGQTCAIRDGRLYCWGSNDFGQVGLGVAALGSSVKVPTQIGTADDWTTVECSVTQTCGIRNGELYCWGAVGARSIISVLGELRPAPKRVGEESDWVAIDPGLYGACGRKASGELRCWGTNAHGELGTTRIPTRLIHEPTQVGEDTDWIRLAAGSTSTCGNRGGQLFCWGAQRSGPITNADSVIISQGFVPARVGSSDNWTGLAMHFAADHACGEVDGISPWCWGSNSHGQLGPDAPTKTSVEPVKVLLNHGVGGVVVGPNTACARTADDVFCWGGGWTGIATVAEAADLPTDTWNMIGTTIGIKGGHVVEWTSSSPAKQSVASMDTGWTKVVSSSNHSCGIRGGRIYCWGANGQGQLGLGIAKINIAHAAAELVDSTPGWLDVAVREGASCGLRNDKTLWCWGGSFFWSADDSLPIAPGPMQVPGQWEAVAMGGEHTCAIAVDGTLWCWGSNWDGQLGLGDYWTSTVQHVELPD